MASILAVSVAVFVALVRRETIRRRKLAMQQWASAQGLRTIDPQDPRAISAIGPLANLKPKVEFLFASPHLALVQLRTEDAAANSGLPGKWKLLIHSLKKRWPPTAMRPTSSTLSVIDLFAMSSYPSLSAGVHFVVFGTDSSAARNLAKTSVSARLPTDIGLLVHGELMILDFTARPFDEIEFGRMIELAEQLIPELV
jgi:hypothetical protein